MSRRRRGFPWAWALALFLAAGPAAADLGKLEVSADYDAEFARAADLLEEGKRVEAEAILETIRKSAQRPAWDARVALLLAADDARRGDDAGAAARLHDVSAAPIGLEPYRLLLRARSLERARAVPEAIAAARSAFAWDGPFAFRLHAGMTLAGLLEKTRETGVALRVLAQAAASAKTQSEIAEVAFERIRLGTLAGDAASVRSAAHDLILKAPTFDASKSAPPAAKAAAKQAEAGLTAAERAARGRALVAAGDAHRGTVLLARDRPESWPAAERGTNLLALARGQLALRKEKDAEATAARVPDDGLPSAYEARLFRCDRVLARLRGKSGQAGDTDSPRFEPVRRALEALTDADAPATVRRDAHARLLRLDADADRFDAALGHAREIDRLVPGASDGFESLWRLAWGRYAVGDYAEARARFDAITPLYDEVSRSRRLLYWRARCLAAEGHTKEAHEVFATLTQASTPDLYARFARAYAPGPPAKEGPALADPSTATAAFARVDELLRLRLFEEASAEGRALPSSRGRDLRLAQSDFALGRFLSAAAAIKRALPEIGTAEEGRVPDAWRRLYYPIEEGGFLAARAREFDLDTGILRGLVRQESVFDATAKSRAGAMGLTQLMPATAKSLAKSVLRQRYRRAFLYDPGVNAQLGAAYLRRLLDQFGNSPVLALAAYNGGPTRIARLVRESPGKPEDELFESIPLYETRDYVRRVLLYAESYRELYP
ncbi:MAG TPA: lytic transglycosylase domain-containing protein [Thermoanaerobaculia bacterium]